MAKKKTIKKVVVKKKATKKKTKVKAKSKPKAKKASKVILRKAKPKAKVVTPQPPVVEKNDEALTLPIGLADENDSMPLGDELNLNDLIPPDDQPLGDEYF